MKLVLVFKFVPDEYLEDFLNGNLYMNTYSHYRATEETINRGDKQEGVVSSYMAKDIQISVRDREGKLVPIGGLINRANFMAHYDHQVNIFCMSLFQPDFSKNNVIEFKLDERFLDFGNKAVLITEPQEFMNKITDSVKGKKSPPCANKFFDTVDYLPNNYNGYMGAFSKLADYEWQREWRIATLDPNRNEPQAVTLSIGDIRAISQVYDTSFLIEKGLNLNLN
jgi:hypothetical protein